jgi:DivIVA domain-containing protein
MAVDETSLERIRKATFPSSRRGYDKREVEKFLNRLADWLETGGGDQARSDTVRKELERVGQRTGSILAEAEESAQQIRGEADREAQEMISGARSEADQQRKDADAYSAEARAAADGYSKETRADSDSYADDTRRDAEQAARDTRAQAEQDSHEMVEAAQAQARRTVEEGVKRRKDIEAVIGDLAGRRDKVISETEKLSAALASSARQHKPSSPAADEFKTPDTLDPLERKAAEGGDELEEEEAATAIVDQDAPEDAGEEAVQETGDEEAIEAKDGGSDGTSKKRSGRRRAKAGSKSKS